MSLIYFSKQDVFHTISDGEMARRHEGLKEILRRNNLAAALLMCRTGEDRHWLNGGRISGIYSGGGGLLSGADVLLPDGDVHILSTVDGFTQWVKDGKEAQSSYLSAVHPGVQSDSAFDAALLLDAFSRAGNRRLGLIFPEKMDVALSEYLEEYVGGYEAVDITAEFEMLRMVHSDEEIEMVRRSVRMHEQVYRAIPALIHSNMTERECVNLIRDLFYRNGCGDLTRWIDCWMDLISNTDGEALPEGEPLFPGRLLQKGDRVDIATHAIGVDAIYAMCARSFILADEPTETTKRLWETATGAHRAAVEALRPGATLKEAAKAANSYLTAHGSMEDESCFLHSVGLAMDEKPRLWDASEEIPLRPGMIVAVMPSAREASLAPLCCGDVYLITDGDARRLGVLPQEITPVYGLY